MCEENNYLLFMGSHYYPSGGWHDYVGSYSNLESAREYAKSNLNRSINDWWQIVDIRTKSIMDNRAID